MVNKFNRNNMKLLIIFLLTVLSSNCKDESGYNHDKLSLNKEAYNGNLLRIDGYYYMKYGNSELFTAYFLYHDGTLLYAGGGKELSNMSYHETNFLKSRYNHMTWWGIFNINDTTIKFERWYPSEPPYWAYVREGIILNDTTFHIIKSYRSNGTEISVEDEVYHFKKFSPKPDSTNVFIK